MCYITPPQDHISTLHGHSPRLNAVPPENFLLAVVEDDKVLPPSLRPSSLNDFRMVSMAARPTEEAAVIIFLVSECN
jgi:hypothetical protein